MQLPNLLATKTGRLGAFFCLYVTEGLPVGFVATAVATQMRRAGVGPAEIGTLVGLFYLPWAWKWAVGPFVDLLYSDRLGRRRAWIVAMQVLMAAMFLIAMPVDFSTEIRLFTILILILNDRNIAGLALVSTIISAVGCVVGGLMSDVFGRKRMLALYLVGTAIPTLWLATVMWKHGWIMPVDPRMPDRPIAAASLVASFWVANVVFAVFQGLMYGTRTALFMDVCTPPEGDANSPLKKSCATACLQAVLLLLGKSTACKQAVAHIVDE